MKTKTEVKAAGAQQNPNKAQVRDAAPGLKVKTYVKAGAGNAAIKVAGTTQ